MTDGPAPAYYGTKRVVAWPEWRDGDKGYAVEYEDGYISWSPKVVFEAAYRKSGEMNFGHALCALQAGHKVCRSGWNGKGMWLLMQRPGVLSKMTLPYVCMFTACKNMVPWTVSQTDMLAEDWMIVEGE